MRALPAGRMLGLSGSLFVLCLAASSGCNSVSFHLPHRAKDAANIAKAKSAVVQPGMELQWTCKAPGDQPGMVRSGKSIVGPDGAVVLGPYGSCPVAGMTLEQAGARAEKHLTAYIKQAHVTLSPVAPPAIVPVAATGDIVWTSANPGAAVAQKSPAQDTRIRPVGGVQEQPPSKEPARPIVTLKPNDEVYAPRIVAVQPMSAKRGGKHHGGPGMPMALSGAPNEGRPVLLDYRIRPPDVLRLRIDKGLVHAQGIFDHTVRPDGTIGLAVYGSVRVAGLTIEEARRAVMERMLSRLAKVEGLEKEVDEYTHLTVLAYNSSVFYVIMDGAGLGEQVLRFPVTGNETVLDAISYTGGLPAQASLNRVWVARPNQGHLGHDTILPVDWRGITRGGEMQTNWQVMPGDRIYVQADPVRRFNNELSKFLQPARELLGITLLGSQTVNSIKTGSVGGSGR